MSAPRMDLALRRSQEDCTESYLLTEGLKLERELDEANKTNRLQYELITTAEKRGVDKSKEELNAAKQRIAQLEHEIELFREHADYEDVCLVEAILKGEEIGRKENQL